VKKQKRGRRTGGNRFLTPEQESEIQKLICDQTPDQLKLKYALWSRDAVRHLIKERYGIEYARKALPSFPHPCHQQPGEKAVDAPAGFP
jgi:transposase